MFKPILLLSAFIASTLLNANAQTDTSSFNLGRISVKKQFTQSITIKDTDLERMQFSDLADAINVWLYGTYTNAASLIYVVDGNIITDVNIYSIYDVDEITLVQSAIAQVTGAGPGQQLVFIKLKTNRPGKQGIEVAGQTSLVNANDHPNAQGYKSSSNIYDQYYLSGYKNFNAFQAGISVDYQHDVIPLITNNSYSAVNPLNFNRFKFNGYLNGKLWTGTTINFGINYVPQQNNESFNYQVATPYVTGETDNNTLKLGSVQHAATSNVAVNSRLGKGLTNTLSAAYSHYNYFEGDSLANVILDPGYPEQNGKTFTGVNSITSNFLLRDNLAYQTKIGDLYIEPSLNFSYRKYKDTYRDSTSTIITSSGLPSINTSEGATALDEKIYLLTPSVNVAYRNIFNFQVGFVSLLNSDKDFTPGVSVDRFFPFASASLDIFKLAKVSDLSLQLFGSFSRQNQLLDDPYQSIDGFGAVGFAVQANPVLFYSGSGTIPFSPVNDVDPLKPLNNYQAGIVLGLCKSFSINYSYFENYNTDLLVESIPYGLNQSELVYSEYYSKISANRIGLDYHFKGINFDWHAGLNIAQEKLKPVNNDDVAASYTTYLNTGHRYSGGFTNRFAYKTFFAGLDILYQLGQRPISLSEVVPYQVPATTHVNSVAVQNLYLGTQIKLSNIKYAELFANFHNILQNNSSNITDNRRFYGLGVKVGW